MTSKTNAAAEAAAFVFCLDSVLGRISFAGNKRVPFFLELITVYGGVFGGWRRTFKEAELLPFLRGKSIGYSKKTYAAFKKVKNEYEKTDKKIADFMGNVVNIQRRYSGHKELD